MWFHVQLLYAIIVKFMQGAKIIAQVFFCVQQAAIHVGMVFQHDGMPFQHVGMPAIIVAC